MKRIHLELIAGPVLIGIFMLAYLAGLQGSSPAQKTPGWHGLNSAPLIAVAAVRG